MRYDIVIIGNNQYAATLVKSLIRDGLKPDLVVTLGGEARAKARIAGISDNLQSLCRDLGVAVYETSGFRLISDRDRAFFEENSFGIGVCTDWQHLLPAHVLDSFEQGVFGFHGSLMAFPNGRGRSPFNWSIRLGGKSIFHNCFRYSEGADEGGVFSTTEIPIGPEETIATLQFKAMVDYSLTIRRLLLSYRAGEISLTPQPVAASVWLPKLTPEDSWLQFEAMNITQLLDVIRASSRPFAGAYGSFEDGKRITISRAARYDGPADPAWEQAPAGEILYAAMDTLLIKCRDGLLAATELSGPIEDLLGKRFV